jgi:hypothetical protein
MSSASILISFHRVAAAFANFRDALGVETAAGAPARQVQTCKLRKKRKEEGEEGRGERNSGRRRWIARLEIVILFSLFVLSPITMSVSLSLSLTL